VDLTGVVEFLQNSALSEWMRLSLKAVPIVNALHVMSIATVFGTIFLVDLRLLGFMGTHRSLTRMHHELVRWTWLAFGISFITGVLLFIVNAVTYYRNTAFWLKMGAIVLAKTMPSWDRGVMPPPAARTAAAISIILWLAVIFFGRWIGFTKGYDFTIPDDVQFEF
jgi:hypothetical protein